MSESDAMFNERDRRCAAVQPMLSTDPSYDSRPIASTLKIVTNNRDMPRVMKTKFPITVMVFGCGFKWGPHHATSYLRSRIESQHQSVPGYADEWGDPLVQSGGRWQTMGVAAGLAAGLQVQRDPGLASEGVLRLCTFLSLASLLPRPEPRWTTSFGHTSRILPTWPPTTPKPAWSPPSAEYSRAPVGDGEKACSQFRIGIEPVIEAEGGYIK